MADTEYQIFFRKELEKAGYTSPKDIPKEKKNDFFNKVDRGWKAKRETNENLSRSAYLSGCLNLLEWLYDSGGKNSLLS